MRLRYILALVLAVTACKKKGGAPEADRELARTIANDALVSIEQSLQQARTRTAHSPSVGFDACNVAMTTLGELRAGPDASLATKLEQICNYDLPVAELAAAVALVEDDAAACAGTSHVATARQFLTRAGRETDDTAAKLYARYTARCATR